MKAFRTMAKSLVVLLLLLAASRASAQQGEVKLNGIGTAGVYIEAFPSFPDVAVQTGNSTVSSFRILNKANTELLRVTAGGRLGVGTPVPNARFMVFNDAQGTSAFLAQQHASYSGNATAYDAGGTGQATAIIPAGVTNSGSALGLSGLAYLQGAGTLVSAYGLLGEASVAPGHGGSIAVAHGIYTRVSRNNGSIGTGYGLYVADVVATNDYGLYQMAPDDSNYLAGDVTVGPGLAPGATPVTKLTVNGNVNVTGSVTGATVIGVAFQDVAEWVPATSDMEPGTVVVLNHGRVNEVMPSHRAYDTSVAGVVSAQPGIILGVGDASKEQIATTGRVKVRVDASRAPVRVGDLLVTSDAPGMAMRSEPVEMNGRRFHQPGTIIGKALEPLESGTGEILVLLSLQ